MSSFTQIEEMQNSSGDSRDENPVIPTVVEHSSILSEDLENLYIKADFTDVTFIVEEQEIKCHRVILAIRSAYFRAMLFGGLKETECNVIPIYDCNLSSFKILLRYIYTGRIKEFLTEEQIIDMLGLAHKFFLYNLENALATHLKTIISIANFVTLFNVAQMYVMTDLIESCLLFADHNAQAVLRHESFSDLSIKAVEELTARDSFCAPEIDIFKAVKQWVDTEPDRAQYSEALLARLRLPLIPQKDLLNTVRPSALLSSDDLLDAIHEQQTKKSTEFVHRGCRSPDINIACIQYGAKVLKGDSQTAFLSGDYSTSMNEYRMTRHNIGDSEGIIVELGKSWIINTIRLFLPDRESKWYSYYVEISMDKKDWLRIVDYSDIPCRGKQTILFCPRAVKYIKMVGVSNSVSNKHFDVIAIEALFSTDKMYQMAAEPFKGFILPADNVATAERFATVIEGVSRSRNALLNGDTKDYDWDAGYTCHQVGSGSITVQFPQPVVISSMRLLLWDCDDRYYSYFVEVSVNQKEWTMVADRKNDQCRSWQLLKFPQIAAVFIRIIGVHNSANEVFHCVHFECPASSRTHDKEEEYYYKAEEPELPPVNGDLEIENDESIHEDG